MRAQLSGIYLFASRKIWITTMPRGDIKVSQPPPIAHTIFAQEIYTAPERIKQGQSGNSNQKNLNTKKNLSFEELS